MMQPFSVTIDIGGVELEVKGNYDPGRPANLTGHPDSWTPAEGGELEVYEVFCQGVKIAAVDLTKFTNAWKDQIWEAIDD